MTAAQSLPLAWLGATATWTLTAVALVGVTVAMVALLRTRMRDSKPWKKCAVLSLWVHVLLGVLASAVRLTSGAPGFGPGDEFGPGVPIRVAILPAEVTPADDDPITAIAETAEPVEPSAPPLHVDAALRAAIQASERLVHVTEPEPPSKPVAEPDDVEPAAESLPALDDEMLEAPALLAAPAAKTQAEEEPEIADESGNTDLAADIVDDGGVADAADATPPATEPTPTEAMPATAAVGTPSTLPPTPPRPAEYASRFASDRAQLVAGGGGDAETERAVAAALAWLAAAQSPDGRWDASRHGAGQERYVLNENRGAAGAKADTGVSGLALLAFLGAGQTHRDGMYAKEVAAGLEFLRQSQAADGSLGGDAEFFARMYCHSMATFAASEAYAISRDERLAPLVRGGVAYTLAAQHPVDGGWRYRPGLEGDTSQLGWQLMALKSAKLAGVDVPEVVWTRADRFMRTVARGRAGGLFAYRPDGPPTRSMTAEGLYCRQMLSDRADGALYGAALDEAVDSLLDEPPTPSAINLYYWYYATLALHHAEHVSPRTKEAWKQWNEAMTRTLLATQKSDGSWPETCLWGGYGGRVFTTSLGAMCLEVYYRYAPPAAAHEATDVAERPDWQGVPARQ